MAISGYRAERPVHSPASPMPAAPERARISRQIGRSRLLRLLFHLGMPVFFGVAIGFQQPGRTEAVGLALAIVYWVALCSVTWSLVNLTCASFAHVFPRLRQGSAFWGLLVGGWLISLPLAYAASASLAQVFASLAPALASSVVLPPMPPEVSGLAGGFLRDGMPGLVLWLATVALFHFGLKLPLFGADPGSGRVAREATHEASTDDVLPGFITKLPLHLRARPIALKAERHYIHVYTEHGSARIHHAFGNALAELADGDGLQVHRSWWVRSSAVLSGQSTPSRLRLVSGLEVPLSRSHLLAAREAGLL